MSDKFSRISIDRLMGWILREYHRDGTIFGIHKALFFVPKKDGILQMTRYGKTLETPLGVAAGPHTQMAQNIIAAWLVGCRYIELKTVQTLDDLEISKPCIDMEDEGYNCEWSQELKIEDAFDEYLNAWVVIHVLRDMFGWDTCPGSGLSFNMSLGYNMEGILKPNVQGFLAQMADASLPLKEKVKQLGSLYPRVGQVAIPTEVSNNVTLSTMHGCPPDEIEKIGLYLINDKGLHTTIKLNPTLLGPEPLRRILNETHRFETQIPDEAFAHDPQLSDAVGLIGNLTDASEKRGLQFSLKLTNTLESVNRRDIFPKTQTMAYMSGRAIHPISINVAYLLQREFGGTLDVSFCAGVDCFNINQVIACGMKPVTVCTDALKPGGYGRFAQYLENLEADGETAAHLRDGRADKAYENLERYASAVQEDGRYTKSWMSGLSIKTNRKLGMFDCIGAPCADTCPTNQDIPTYMRQVAAGDIDGAFETVLKTNPFPGVTGMVCDHLCQTKCTRINYDSPLMIREIKRFVTQHAAGSPTPTCAPSNGISVGVIGAGPAGLACAYFLAVGGFEVHVYEAKGFAGGMVSDAIPSFRLTDGAIGKDVERIVNMGVRIHYNTRIDKAMFEKLRIDHDYLNIAVGALRAKAMGVPGEDAKGVVDQLTFLSEVRRGKGVDLGRRVLVIGGGNSAMDAARTAHRLVEKPGRVTLVYRRTQREMPADPEELAALLGEQIDVLELTMPVGIKAKDGRVSALVCNKMVLCDTDDSGRRRPEKVPDGEFEIPADTIIPAIGQDVVIDFAGDGQLQIDPETLETSIANVFCSGDALRGASSVIKAIGDGRRVAVQIVGRTSQERDRTVSPAETLALGPRQQKAARRVPVESYREIPLERRRSFEVVIEPLSKAHAQKEAQRCLLCNEVCDVCVSVCPNRANVSYRTQVKTYQVARLIAREGEICFEEGPRVSITQPFQTANIGDFCNECGNCETFCPTSGAPFRDKPKLFLTEASFAGEDSGYYIRENRIQGKAGGSVESLWVDGNSLVYTIFEGEVKMDRETLEIQSVSLKDGITGTIDLRRAVAMKLLLDGLGDILG